MGAWLCSNRGLSHFHPTTQNQFVPDHGIVLAARQGMDDHFWSLVPVLHLANKEVLGFLPFHFLETSSLFDSGGQFSRLFPDGDHLPWIVQNRFAALALP